MKNKEIVKALKGSWKDKPVEVLVKIEGGLYYPIKEIVKNKDGTFTIIGRNLTEHSVIGPAKWYKNK